MAKKSNKRYRLGGKISISDANRLIGIPAKTPLDWGEFQDYASSKLSSNTQKILRKESSTNGI